MSILNEPDFLFASCNRSMAPCSELEEGSGAPLRIVALLN